MNEVHENEVFDIGMTLLTNTTKIKPISGNMTSRMSVSAQFMLNRITSVPIKRMMAETS